MDADRRTEFDAPTLLDYAHTLAGLGLYPYAAAFGERAVPPGAAEPTQVRIAWWLLRADRPADALHRLAAVDDPADSLVPLLRDTATAMAEPDRAGRILGDLLSDIGTREPGAAELCCVSLVANAAGDRVTEVNAARGRLALIDGPDPAMCAVIAGEQALDGHLPDAVRSAEIAISGRPDDPDAPLRRIVARLDEVDRGTAADFLAGAFTTTRRTRYGELLAERVPWRLRYRNRFSGFSVVALCLATALLMGNADLLWPAAATLFGLSAAATLAALLIRAPKSNAARTNRIAAAYGAYRLALGRNDAVLSTLGLGGAAFTVTGVLVKGHTHTWTVASLGLALAVTLLVAGGTVALALRGRARATAERARAAQVDPERCRCWETDQLLGGQWHRYRTEHLEPAGSGEVDEPTAAEVLRCARTRKVWLHLPRWRIAVPARHLNPADSHEHEHERLRENAEPEHYVRPAGYL